MLVKLSERLSTPVVTGGLGSPNECLDVARNVPGQRKLAIGIIASFSDYT
jgi:hypothetical protein